MSPNFWKSLKNTTPHLCFNFVIKQKPQSLLYVWYDDFLGGQFPTRKCSCHPSFAPVVYHAFHQIVWLTVWRTDDAHCRFEKFCLEYALSKTRRVHGDTRIWEIWWIWKIFGWMPTNFQKWFFCVIFFEFDFVDWRMDKMMFGKNSKKKWLIFCF